MQALTLRDKQHIKSIELFFEFKAEDFVKLYKIIQVCEFNSNANLMSEITPNEYIYVLLEGEIEVYTGEQGTPMIFGPGKIIDDTLHSSPHKTSSIVTITRVRLAEIPKAFLKKYHLVEKKLSTHHLQNYNRMLKLIDNLHFINLTPEEVHYIHDENYAVNQIIFSQGEEGKAVYFIIKGLVRIIKKKGKKETIIAKLSDGQCFGELAILEEQKRAATAIAEHKTHLLKIDKMLFLKWHNAHPIFRAMLHSLKQVYHLKDDSLISMYTGKFKGKDCITTTRIYKNGDNFISTKVINEDTVLFYKLIQADNNKIKRFVYTSAKNKVKREIELFENKIIGVVAEGHWLKLDEVIHYIVKGKPISLSKAEQFQHYGEIDLGQVSEISQENYIVCNCMHVTYKDVSHFMNIYGHDMTKIIKATGATIVCGNCKNILAEIVNKSSCTPKTQNKSK